MYVVEFKYYDDLYGTSYLQQFLAVVVKGAGGGGIQGGEGKYCDVLLCVVCVELKYYDDRYGTSYLQQFLAVAANSYYAAAAAAVQYAPTAAQYAPAAAWVNPYDMGYNDELG